MSEAVMCASLCAPHELPVTALSGDQQICQKIREWVPVGHTEVDPKIQTRG